MKLSDFLITLRQAVNSASNALTERNLEFFNKYFETKNISETETIRIPKTVRMDYPVVTESGDVTMKRMDVPIISLIPVTNSKLGKATFSIDFQLEEENDAITVHFPKKRFGEHIPMTHMEFTIVPDEVPDGISNIIDNYNSIITRQIEG